MEAPHNDGGSTLWGMDSTPNSNKEVTMRLIMHKYRGFTGTARLDEDGDWVGRVDLPRDIVTFVHKNVNKLQAEFEISVDVYLDFVAEQEAKS